MERWFRGEENDMDFQKIQVGFPESVMGSFLSLVNLAPSDITAFSCFNET